MVEYRAWNERLRRFLTGAEESNSATLDQPACEFMEWLDQNVGVASDALGDRWWGLHQRLQAITHELMELARSGASDLAFTRFPELDSATAAVLAVLRRKIQACEGGD